MNKLQSALLPAIASLLTIGAAHAELVYVSNSGSDSITLINTTAGTTSTFVSTTSNLNGPTGIIADNSGNFFVANNNGGAVAEYDSTGNFLGNFATGQHNPRDMAFDSAGNLYIANQSNGTVTQFTPGGVGSIFASGLQTPNSLAFDSTGNLFVTNGTGNSITEITPGMVFSTVTFSGPAISAPHGIAIDSAGNIFVVNTVGASIEKISGGVGSIFATIDQGALPKSLAVDSEGNVFVTDYGDNTVTEYNSLGAVINTFSTGSGPCGIVILPDSVTTVPEPSTYALMFAGLGALFFINRRKLAKVRVS